MTSVLTNTSSTGSYLLKTPRVSHPQKYLLRSLFTQLQQQSTKAPLYKSTFLQQHFSLPLGSWQELFKLIPPKHKFRKQVTYMDTSKFQLADEDLWLLMESKPENFNSTMDAKEFSNFEYKLKTVKAENDALYTMLEVRESEILKIVSGALGKELSSMKQLEQEMDILNTFITERYFFVEEMEYELYVDVARLGYKSFYIVGTLRLKSHTISDTEYFNQLMSQLAQLEVMVPVQSKITKILQTKYPGAYKSKAPVLHMFDPTTDQHPFETEVYAAWLRKELDEAKEYYKSCDAQEKVPFKPLFVDDEEMLTVYLMRNTIEQGVENPKMICATGIMKSKAFDPKFWDEDDYGDEEEEEEEEDEDDDS